MSKRILITGRDSYIGTSFEHWMAQYQDEYIIDTVATTEDEWRNKDFGQYDILFHVAGIAHVDTPKSNSPDYEKTKQLYYKVNRDITIDVAKKAKAEGVKQFIFMSSIIVYGDSNIIGKKRVITKDTVPAPTNFYGDSKLQAEQGVLPLQTDSFQVVVLRPPMIYGKGSKGNYPKLSKLARICPAFPDIDNERSMLYVDNLCECIRLVIEDNAKGIFFPQNREYVKTTELVHMIAGIHGKRLHTIKLFNHAIIALSNRIRLLNKVFGNLVYDKELSSYRAYDYCIYNMQQSIGLTEGKKQ